MTHSAKNNLLFFYFFISILFIDTIFKYTTIKGFLLIDTLLSSIFLLVYVLVLYFILSFFYGYVKFAISALLLGFVAFIYTSQLIYYKFFKTFYSFYSVGNSKQALGFWKDILQYVMKNSFWIIVLFLPVIVLLIFGRQYFSFAKTSWFTRFALVLCIVLTQLVGVSVVKVSGKHHHSAYDLYYRTSLPELSTQRLGLFTTMRLDIQRLLTSWSPMLAEKPFETHEEEHNYHEEQKPIETEEIDNNDNVEEAEKQVEYNVLDIDFEELIANETDPELKEMHTYFSNVEPTAKNEYTGKYKDFNLILLTAEAFSPYAVHSEITPTLYQMVHEGYHFTNFYTPIWEVSTSDGEYVALNSLLPKSGVWSFKESSSNHLPFALGNQLNDLGYRTKAYHNHTYTYYGRDLSHPNMGYDYKGLGNGLDVEETWPESDLEMMEKTITEYIDDQPFHAYYMTVSGHMQYSFTGNYIAWKNRSYVDDLPYSEQAKAYLATQIELDRALEYLLEQLEHKGIAEKTLIALSADHHPYGLDDETIDEFVGHPIEENFELYENHFILYTVGMESVTITKPASSLDILPTLSNLLDLEYDSRLMMGRDIFSDSPSLIPFLNKSFITNEGKYNSTNQKFVLNDGKEIDHHDVEKILSTVQEKFYYSAKVLEKDYYQKIFNE